MNENLNKEWRCFHCDEIFTDYNSARVHFGDSIVCTPLCQMSGQMVRNIEESLRKYRDEDTDLHRHISRIETEMQIAVGRANEKGYADGLRDANHHEPNPDHNL